MLMRLYLGGTPLDYVTNLDVFMETVRADAAEFQPLGEKVHEYRIKEEKGVEAEFEIYQVGGSVGGG